MRTLYPPIEPYHQAKLPVSDLHTLYFEQVGNAQGYPVLFLHGGPGGGINAFYRQYFDPQRWRVILFDQRGCGKSTPYAEVRENTTWDLVADIERLRVHLGIEQWTIFGGSWGSTLALAYSETHPHRCNAVILRGVFTLRRKELLWFYQEGANYLFPEAWEHYLNFIPPEEQGDLMMAYHRRLFSEDKAIRLAAARAWSLWEASTSKLYLDPELMAKFTDDVFAEAFARIENHYFVNGGFLETDDQLLRNAHKIAHLPGVIVQGRYDVVCPITSAWELHQAWPKAEWVVIPDAGHSISEPGICSALLEATDRFADGEKFT
ncbi:MAG: prolyl aminopeptidase [Beggiatoa sp. IS2]|nr:MAG: prolyl aminopeptidase [Beggiatoa sp. IS2]